MEQSVTHHCNLYKKWRLEFHNIIDKKTININCIDDVLVFYNSILNYLELQNVEQNDVEKTNLQKLVDEIPEIKTNFHKSGGQGMPTLQVIYANPNFINWKSRLQFELNKLQQDEYVKQIIDLLISFNGWHDTRDFEELTSKVKVLSNNIGDYTNKSILEEKVEMDEPIIFISHSSKDKKCGDIIVSMLRGLGIKREQLIFTTDDDYGIPIGANIFEYLRSRIGNGAYVIYLLSDNYYNSVACLNEMGAAWMVQNDYSVIGVPEFSFNKAKFSKGAIDPRRIGFNINNKKRLVEFKNLIANKFHLTIDEVDWNNLLNKCVLDTASL